MAQRSPGAILPLDKVQDPLFNFIESYLILIFSDSLVVINLPVAWYGGPLDEISVNNTEPFATHVIFKSFRDVPSLIKAASVSMSLESRFYFTGTIIFRFFAIMEQ
jgi:hypothetical protein